MDSPSGDDDLAAPPCVMTFNAVDPSGGGGLAADVLAIASVGGHALPVVTGAFVRDTGSIADHFALDDEAVAEQARMVLEDAPVQVIKVGFAAHPATLGAIADLAGDYPDIPVIAAMPDLSWWDQPGIDNYLDAFTELLLPQVTVLVGNHSTLRRWLLPDWSGDRAPGPRDLARAAADHGAPYTLVTGIALPGGFVDNVLATPQTVLASQKFERFEAVFTGAGDTLSAALAALLATGSDLPTAAVEALQYLDDCLEAGFRTGMGHVVPDRLFWAQPDTDGEEPDDAERQKPHDFFDDPFNETRH